MGKGIRYKRGELAPSTQQAIRLIHEGLANKEIASRLGLSADSVYRIRRDHTNIRTKPGSGVAGTRVLHQPHFLRRLGREKDTYIAKQYGMTAERVRQIRKQYGIPVVKKWYPFEDELGKRFDASIAADYGYSINSICAMRKKRGILAYAKS